MSNKETMTHSKYLQPCGLCSEDEQVSPFTMVIFGGGGDLSRRKLLPTLYHLFKEKMLPENFTILSFGSPPDGNDQSYRKRVLDSFEEFEPGQYDKKSLLEFVGHVFFQGGYFDDDERYHLLKKRILELSFPDSTNKIQLLYYMSVHPSFIPIILEKMQTHRLAHDSIESKIIVEKPFGTDLNTARKLNDQLHTVFQENQIFRIDHYLGKETVQNIIFFRFTNNIFEPLWNREHIDSVQITVAEELGVEHRGNFYEKAGVIRDIVQNHILQLIAFIAMEPPIGFEADFIRNEKVKVFNSIRSMDKDNINTCTVQGQYGPGANNGKELTGYRKEFRVDEHSQTPTFFAAKLHIDNWRWAGVPFYVRTGKRMPQRSTDIVIQFKQPPLKLFGTTCDTLEPSILRLRIQPEEEITMSINVKHPNNAHKVHHIDMNFNYKDAFHEKSYPAYSRLILDCIKGDLTLFVREDSIDTLWQIVDPIINQWECADCSHFPNYAAGSWGPEEANQLLENDGRYWYNF